MANFVIWGISGVALTSIAIGLGYIFYLRRQLAQERTSFEEQQAQQDFFMKAIPAPWCAWYVGAESYVLSSDAFLELLRLNDQSRIILDDIFKVFQIDAFSPMRKAIQHLVDFGGAFNLQTTLPQANKEIQITGKCIELTVGKKTSKLIILYLYDLTQHLQYQRKNDLFVTQLQNDNHILSTLTNISPMALWHRDQEGRIIYCNEAYAGALDTTEPRVIAENLQLIDSAQTSLLSLSRQALAHNEKMTIRSHIVISGQRRLLEIAEVPLHEKGMTVGYALDVTEVEEVERELTTMIRGYEEILNQLSTPIAVYGADTRLQFYNAAYLKIFQLNENFLLTKPSLSEILDDLRARRKIPEYADFQAHKRSRMQMFTNLMDTEQELSHLPDGTTLRLMISPHPMGGLVFLFDNITDKLALERGFNTLIAVQRETIDHLYEGILVIGSDLRVRLSNPAIEKIWNITEDARKSGIHFNEWVLSISKKFTSNEQLDDWQQKALSHFASRKPSSESYKLKRDRLIECSYVPLPDGSHMLCFVDVSDRWRYEKALKNRNRTLETVDKAKSDFISHVSYELKSPLSTITGFSDILMNQYFGQLNEKQLDYCRAIHQSADKLIQLLNDIIDLTSIETGKFVLNYSEIDIDRFIKSTVALVESRANDQGVDLGTQNLSSLTIFVGDEKRLKHALFNLLTNAIKYTPHGGRVALRVEDKDGKIQFIVEDNGVGIPLEIQERLENLFDQNNPERENIIQSNQLGLPLVKNLVELHQGSVKFESSTDKGTIVRCLLPISATA